MTSSSPLEPAWGRLEGRECLFFKGWLPPELRRLRGLDPEALSAAFSLYHAGALAAPDDALQPVAGRFSVEGDALCFLPRFPCVPGEAYVLVFGKRRLAWAVKPPEAATAEAMLTAMYPSGSIVPVNLLRLYFHFSAPMSEGYALKAVKVRLAATGELLDGVFLDMDPELWDSERRRLTLLLDPGRIKRGLAPNLEAGYPLVQGKDIIITVETAFRDASGRPLRDRADRRYRVGQPLRRLVKPGVWRMDLPGAGSLEPLRVAFDRPLDAGLLRHCLTVEGPDKRPLKGSSVIGPAERTWVFAPQRPWLAGLYRLVVDPRLEDIAGNNLVRVFDRDLTRPEDFSSDAGPRVLAFGVSALS